MIVLSTTLRTFHWDGMGDLFPIGCINYMDWEWSISVRYVEIPPTGEERLLRTISRDGDTLTE
jgi:hypothetical protein